VSVGETLIYDHYLRKLREERATQRFLARARWIQMTLSPSLFVGVLYTVTDLQTAKLVEMVIASIATILGTSTQIILGAKDSLVPALQTTIKLLDHERIAEPATFSEDVAYLKQKIYDGASK
jgi:hypothetical protein